LIIGNEIETTLRARIRYRVKHPLEPGIVVNVGQRTVAFGPWIGGLLRLSASKKLRCEPGHIAGLDEFVIHTGLSRARAM